ncbi:MAG: hypothetical protein ACLP8X_21545 [Streptosporangiaceae bacterium]
MDSKAPGVGEGPAKVVSVSLPEGTVLALRELAGRRGLSALVDAAVQEYLRNHLTAAYLEQYEREHGRFTEEERRSAAEVWEGAERRQAQWPAAG